MGKINQGILGGFSGKVGNVIGGNWKGIDYMRVKPSSVSNPRTAGQVDQRTRFAIIMQFLQPMREFIKVGFKNYAIKMTEFNSAMSYNVKNAIVGEYPDFMIDFDAALISRGSLAAALNPAVNSSTATAGTVNFDWSDNSEYENASANDKAMLLLYNQAKNEALFITDGSSRSAGSHSFTVPAHYSGDSVHAFIAFISEDGKRVSNSRYIDTLEVA